MKKLLILFLLAVLLLTACDKPDRVSDDAVESTQESTEEKLGLAPVFLKNLLTIFFSVLYFS